MTKVAVVTGGAQGIGRALCVHLLKNAYTVVAADKDEAAGRDLLSNYGHLGPLTFIQTDVAKEADVARLVAETVQRHGRVDVLVSNAGVGRTKLVTELSLDEWNDVIGTNLTAAFLCAKHTAPYLEECAGAIVLIASTRAFMSEPNTEAYAASKGGLIALTHALAVSLGPRVRVNAVSPGWIEVGPWQKDSVQPNHSEADKKQHPVGRVGRAEDVAELVHFLVSERSSFITGQNFTVDGGMTIKMIYE